MYILPPPKEMFSINFTATEHFWIPFWGLGYDLSIWNLFLLAKLRFFVYLHLVSIRWGWNLSTSFLKYQYYWHHNFIYIYIFKCLLFCYELLEYSCCGLCSLLIKSGWLVAGQEEIGRVNLKHREWWEEGRSGESEEMLASCPESKTC